MTSILTRGARDCNLLDRLEEEDVTKEDEKKREVKATRFERESRESESRVFGDKFTVPKKLGKGKSGRPRGQVPPEGTFARLLRDTVDREDIHFTDVLTRMRHTMDRLGIAMTERGTPIWQKAHVVGIHVGRWLPSRLFAEVFAETFGYDREEVLRLINSDSSRLRVTPARHISSEVEDLILTRPELVALLLDAQYLSADELIEVHDLIRGIVNETVEDSR